MTLPTLQGRGGSIPAYLQLSHYIRDGITHGLWEVGEMIPTEKQLAAKFQVSIGTVRQAINLLCHDSLLIKRQGLGTFVLKPVSVESEDLLGDVLFPFELLTTAPEEATISSSLKEIKTCSASIEEANSLGIKAGEAIWQVCYVHTVQNRVIAYEVTSIAQSTNPYITIDLLKEHAGDLQRLASEVIKKRIDRVTDKVRVDEADDLVAKVFGPHNKAQPFLRVYRVTATADDKPINHREIWIDPTVANYKGSAGLR